MNEQDYTAWKSEALAAHRKEYRAQCGREMKRSLRSAYTYFRLWLK